MEDDFPQRWPHVETHGVTENAPEPADLWIPVPRTPLD